MSSRNFINSTIQTFIKSACNRYPHCRYGLYKKLFVPATGQFARPICRSLSYRPRNTPFCFRFVGTTLPDLVLKQTSLSRCGFHSTEQRRIEEDKHTKAVAVWTNLRQLRSSPIPALMLGLSGLIPFVAAPAFIISSGAYLPQVAFAQLAYGASILSFLGGVRWGFVIPEENPIQANWMNLGYSVTPSLIAWSGLLMPHPAGLLTVMAGLGFAAYADMAMYGYPAWFKGMRFLLSFVAILSLWSTFMCSLVMTGETNKVDGVE